MPAAAPGPSAQADAGADDTGFQPGTRTGPITQGINTDQSLPEHPVRGPTATLPEGAKQIGH